MEWHLKASLLVFVLIKVTNVPISLLFPRTNSLLFYNSLDNKHIFEFVGQTVIIFITLFYL